MEKANNMKVLYIIVNAGFSDEVVEIARQEGAGGATIMNSRGSGTVHKEFFGITIDVEKEMILSLVDGETAEKVMAAVKEKAGLKSPASGICFTMPVEKATLANKHVQQDENQE